MEKERDIALQKIEDYRERKRSEGEGFYLSLQTQRESLDGLRANNDRFIRGSHTVKIIEEHKDRLDTLQKALSTTKPLSVDFDDYEHIQGEISQYFVICQCLVFSFKTKYCSWILLQRSKKKTTGLAESFFSWSIL